MDNKSQMKNKKKSKFHRTRFMKNAKDTGKTLNKYLTESNIQKKNENAKQR